MADNDYVQVWEESQEYELDLSDSGKIIDFLEPEKERPNKAEERVRQRIARVLHFEYGYPKELMCFEAPIRMGRDLRHADIAIYASPAARVQKDQGKILLVCEVKAPEIKECDGQLVSYVSASSAEGGIVDQRHTSGLCAQGCGCGEDTGLHGHSSIRGGVGQHWTAGQVQSFDSRRSQTGVQTVPQRTLQGRRLFRRHSARHGADHSCEDRRRVFQQREVRVLHYAQRIRVGRGEESRMRESAHAVLVREGKVPRGVFPNPRKSTQATRR